MSCERWRQHLIEALYDECDERELAELRAHRQSCPDCERAWNDLAETRRVLAEAGPAVPSAPRVVILTPRTARRAWPVFAAGAACAVLLVAIAIAAVVAHGGAIRMASAPPAVPVVPAAVQADLERTIEAERAAMRRQLDDQWSRTQELIGRASAPGGISRDELQSILAGWEQRAEQRRRTDRRYLLDEIAASELRSGQSIGDTRRALQLVALANSPDITVH